MANREVELLAIGAGPSNLGLAVALEELAPDDLARNSLVIERNDSVIWQGGMLLPWARSQVSYLKDLVTLRNPQSRFSFLNFLHTIGRLNDFVNLGATTPYRSEISAYLQWVASTLEKVEVEFGQTCLHIEPRRDSGGTLRGWQIGLADGSTIGCTVLTLAVGRDVNIPPEFAALPEERVVHSTEYLPRVREFAARPPEERPQRVAVIGGAQSSAEMLWAVLRDLPGCEPTLVMRSIGFTLYQTSKFTNELYYPGFVDEFYHALPEAQEQMLREMHHTNYSGLNPTLLEDLYRQVYLERLSGQQRLRILHLTDVRASRMEGDQVVLTLRDRKTGRVQELYCDVVLLGTGYSREVPALVRHVGAALGLSRVEVTRNYRLAIEEPTTAACYVQGINEATHGIADSLLSVVAPRSAEIVADVMARREEDAATLLPSSAGLA